MPNIKLQSQQTLNKAKEGYGNVVKVCWSVDLATWFERRSLKQ